MLAQTDLLKALPVAVYITDAEGRLTFYNQAAEELWGSRPDLNDERWHETWRLFWPDGQPLPYDESPMAVALREGRDPVRGIEAVAERPGGLRIPFLPFPTPLRDEAGRTTGAVNLLVDISERRRAEIESSRLAAIVTSSDDAIVSKTLEGRVTSWNASAARMFGYEAEEMIGQPITRIIPRDLHHEEDEILARLRRGEPIKHYETTRVGKDGRLIDVSVSVSPVRDSNGVVVGASKVARDVSERKQAEKAQRLLIEELNHRVKNTLATVQAIATQSSNRARTPADFVASFSGRIQALARAHTLLADTRMEGAELTELVREQVMLGEGNDTRISCAGPALMLDSRLAVHLAMVLHELATNARKYGALSVPKGRLSVSWIVQNDRGRFLHLFWTEQGGPDVTVPTSRGFGTTLIEQTLRGDGGSARLSYHAGGVAADINLPLPELADGANRPIWPAAAPGTTPRLVLAGEATPHGRKRVLIVEDEPLVAMDLEAMLTAAGCDMIGPAATLVEARQLVARKEFDAALLDVNLAGEAVDELAVTLTRDRIPFAFVTGYGRQGLPRGFQDALLIAKPFRHDQLLAALEILIGQPADIVPLRTRQR